MERAGPDPVSVRAVLLSPGGTILLVRVGGADGGGLWITPGGRIEPGEEAREALERELREETGALGLAIGPEIWVRHGTYGPHELPERERFFLTRTPEFEPVFTDERETARVRELRWWAIGDVARSGENFVPRRLGELLSELVRAGPPRSPIETGP